MTYPTQTQWSIVNKMNPFAGPQQVPRQEDLSKTASRTFSTCLSPPSKRFEKRSRSVWSVRQLDIDKVRHRKAATAAREPIKSGSSARNSAPAVMKETSQTGKKEVVRF